MVEYVSLECFSVILDLRFLTLHCVQNPTEIVDAIVPIYCHSLPLPCSNKKPAQPLNSSSSAATSKLPAKPTNKVNPPATTTTASLPPGEGKDTDSGEEDHTATGFLRSNNNARIEACIQLPYLEDIMVR
jgi:hypothetical protein